MIGRLFGTCTTRTIQNFHVGTKISRAGMLRRNYPQRFTELKLGLKVKGLLTPGGNYALRLNCNTGEGYDGDVYPALDNNPGVSSPELSALLWQTGGFRFVRLSRCIFRPISILVYISRPPLSPVCLFPDSRRACVSVTLLPPSVWQHVVSSSQIRKAAAVGRCWRQMQARQRHTVSGGRQGANT